MSKTKATTYLLVAAFCASHIRLSLRIVTPLTSLVGSIKDLLMDRSFYLSVCVSERPKMWPISRDLSCDLSPHLSLLQVRTVSDPQDESRLILPLLMSATNFSLYVSSINGSSQQFRGDRHNISMGMWCRCSISPTANILVSCTDIP